MTEQAANVALAATSLPDLHDRLDTLWTTYLHHVDQYVVCQKSLQKQMSAGFLSLARANFNARNGVRRYGKDFYHERATAARRVRILAGEEDGSGAKFEIVEHHPESADDEGNVETESKPQEMKPEEPIVQQPSPPATPAPQCGKDDKASADDDATKIASDAAPAETSSQPKAKTASESDPLRWFGILVPQELRSAQTSFSSTVDDTVTDAVNTARGMREAEVEIRKLRKEIRKAEKERKP